MFKHGFSAVCPLPSRVGWKSLATGLCAVILQLSTPTSVVPQSLVAIRGGTVMTMAGETFENGTVLIRNGKISEVGPRVTIPANAEVFDASGKFILPGIVDAMTYYNIRPFPPNVENDPITPECRIIEAYYPFGDFRRGEGGIRKDREILSGGITTVYIAPGNRQVVGGQGAVVKTYGKDFDGLVLSEPAAIDMTIGDPALNPRSTGVSPVTRMAMASLLRSILVDAQHFNDVTRAYEEKSAAEKETTPKPRRDLELEPLARLLSGEIPGRIESDYADDIRTAIRISEEFGFDLVIDGGMGAYRIKDMLAARNIPVVLPPISHPFTTGDYSAEWFREMYTFMDERNAAMLHEAGVKIALASFRSGDGFSGRSYPGRWLLLEVGLAVRFGLPEEEALKAVTINPAQILGVDDRVGSLEPGKDADVIILDGSPLSVKTWVDHVFVDGELVYSREEPGQ